MRYRAGFLPGTFESQGFSGVEAVTQEKGEVRSAGFWLKHRNTLCGVFVVALILLLGSAGFFFRASLQPQPSPPAPQEPGGIGVVDLARAEKVHEVYAQIAALDAERAVIAADIARLSADRRAWKPPALSDEPFQLAAEQKELQQERLAAEGRARERRKALAAWEEETKEAFLAEKKMIEDAYQNRIVNIEMKIDNREAMLLSADDVKTLLQELETLRNERGTRIEALFAARDEKRRQYLAALIARDEALGKSSAAQEEAARQKAEADKRNSEALRQAMQGMEIDELLNRKRAALAAKDEEIRILREHIRKDIESKTAKLAIVHRLAFVVVKETDEAVGVRREEAAATMLRFPVHVSDAVDLTDEVIAELASGTILERSGKS